MVDQSDFDLLEALGVELQPESKAARTPREERIIAGFEDIQRFYDNYGRLPRHGRDGDIFERLYAVRLDRLRELEECRTLLLPLDRQGLLNDDGVAAVVTTMDDDALLAALEVDAGGQGDLGTLRHVRSVAEKRAAEDIANRTKCEDFSTFRPLFAQVQKELEAGIRQTRPFVKDAGFLKADIQVGQFFVLGGQTVYVADIGSPIKAPNGEMDARLRVIYSNGTESDLLLRSLQRALYKDDSGRRITEPSAGPLFDSIQADEDAETGLIYVLRSKSDHPVIASHRQVLHKIGVTGSSIEQRIANAKFDPTYLMAEVEVVATYRLCNINRSKLEHLIHRFFDAARLDIEIMDRFGHPVSPKEWFLVPRFVIDEVVERIRDGSIVDFAYDPGSARLLRVDRGYTNGHKS